MIPFNKPPYTGNEDIHVLAAMKSGKISGDGKYGLMCQRWFEDNLICKKTLLTPSCTHALEMAAMLIDIQPGDEVIMPSYTFVSTANPFVLRGAQIVFVDIRPDTMNIDEKLIEDAITPKTKAIVPVHYAGISCEMDVINDIALRHNLIVIEDAAQGMRSTYKGKPLGTLGHLAAYSFHETKNFTSGGEGGLLIINDDRLTTRAEIIREKGTNRTQFFRGMVDKYTWVDIGSSHLPSEIQAAYLWGQLEKVDEITLSRINTWEHYKKAFAEISKSGKIELPFVPEACTSNGHMFYIKTKNLNERTELLSYLKRKNILAVFHYIPLHSAPAGIKFGKFHGEDVFTTAESEKLLRLPLWHAMDSGDVLKVVDAVIEFYQ